jgi:uncharacterized protein (TIGR00255 family)
MTGYCKDEVSYKDLRCSIEVRSVNHKFLEARIFLPRQFQHLEDSLKKKLRKRITRGKVDINMQLNGDVLQEDRLSVNLDVWENVKSIVKIIEQDIDKNIQVNMADLLQVKGLLSYQQEEKNQDDYEKLFEMALEKGIDGLIEMRGREGESLLKDISSHIDELQGLVDQIPEFRPEIIEFHKQRLKKNLEKLDFEYNKDDPRIVQEMGLFMDRSDVTEELERFDSHLSQFRHLLKTDKPVGRKFDFLIQELYREANTLCSKANHIQVTRIGVDLKCEIEKVREQIQNIE